MLTFPGNAPWIATKTGHLIHLWRAGHRLWEFTPDGNIQCFDPPDPRARGDVVAGPHEQLGIGSVVSLEGRIWTGTYDSIERLRPPRPCVARKH